MLLRRTKSHNRLNPAAIVPASIEKDDLACTGEMSRITLKIPLCFLHVRWLVECDDTRTSGIEMFGNPLNCSPFAGGITPFKNHQDFEPFVFDIILKFEKFNLEFFEFFFVF